MIETPITQKLRLRFLPYKNLPYLFLVNEINIRNTVRRFFSLLGVKRLSITSTKEDLLHKVRENVREPQEDRYALCVMHYHRKKMGNGAYIATLLQPINKAISLPSLVLADTNESLEIQFGKKQETRMATIRAAARFGLKGIISGDLNDATVSQNFVQKMIEVLEEDELAKMSLKERRIRKLINTAYSYLNKIFGSAEEKEQNINKALVLFEEVLKESKANCEALLGKAIACSSSSDPEKILEGTSLFAQLDTAGKDLVRVYEGHTVACYKMAEIVKEESEQGKWLLKGVGSLSQLVEWELKEYNETKKVDDQYEDVELKKDLSNKYSNIASSLTKVGGEYTKDAIKYYLKGINMDPSVEGNYKVIRLLEEDAKERDDYLKIAKICVTAKKNMKGKEIDFLSSEAEACYKAGLQNEATKLYNSIDEYVSMEKIEELAAQKKKSISPSEKEMDLLASFISFLNHRAIYFRKLGNHEKSIQDLHSVIALDIDKKYYDIYFNMAKAIISAVSDHQYIDNYELKDAFDFLVTSVSIALDENIQIYEKLLKTITKDTILAPYVHDLEQLLKKSDYPIPIFFKKMNS